MESAYAQARAIYKQMQKSGINPAIASMVKSPISYPAPVITTPKQEVEKPKVKKVIKKKSKVIKRLDGKPQRFGPSKKQVENTQVYFASLPADEIPIVRMISNLFNLDPDSLVTTRLQTIKDLVETAAKHVGADEGKIIEWIRAKRNFYKVQGDRAPEALRLMLKMG